MFKDTPAYFSFSVDDIGKAKDFYTRILGLDVEETDEGLGLTIAGGFGCFVYPKGRGHVSATFTVLNFPVDDVEQAVDALAALGVRFEQYDNEYIRTDGRGIARMGPRAMAWFTDPAGNILSVIEEKK